MDDRRVNAAERVLDTRLMPVAPGPQDLQGTRGLCTTEINFVQKCKETLVPAPATTARDLQTSISTAVKPDVWVV